MVAPERPTGTVAAIDQTDQEPERGDDMPARGSAEWKGDVPTGTGTFTAGDTISGEYSYKSRFEDGPGANPEQLIAAAHASCFSMALSNLLAQAGTPPESVHTDATVTLRLVDGAPTITAIALATVGRVPPRPRPDARSVRPWPAFRTSRSWPRWPTDPTGRVVMPTGRSPSSEGSSPVGGRDIGAARLAP
jgi:osmotically inducible protein OsmC